MKILPLLAAFAFATLSPVGAAPPALTIDKALKLAQDHLTGRGLTTQHYIGSLTLEQSTLVGGEQYWFARWVPSIPEDKKKESGLRINMDGSLVRLVTGGRSSAAGRAVVDSRSLR